MAELKSDFKPETFPYCDEQLKWLGTFQIEWIFVKNLEANGVLNDIKEYNYNFTKKFIFIF